MPATMLKLHPRTQQTPALVATALCAARATLENIEKPHEFKNFDSLLMPQHFCHSKFLTK
jgi:hypothetical protein